MRKCIYCGDLFTQEKPCSREHFIPEFLGGFWWERFACTGCNSEFGDSIDAEWQKNHEVIKAMSQLGLPIDPNVFKLAKRAPPGATGFSPYELIAYAKTKAPFFVDRQRGIVNIDRAFVSDHVKGANALTGLIQKESGLSRNEAMHIANDSIQRLTRLGVGQTARIEKILPKCKLIISSTPQEVHGTLNMLDHYQSTVAVRSVVKIAYGFAAILLQNDIFHPEYDNVRRFLKIPDSGVRIRAVTLDTIWENLKPLHVLASRTMHNKLYIIIVLFHCMGFVVELGPALSAIETQRLFDIIKKTPEPCHFATDSEHELDRMLRGAFAQR